MHILVLFGAKRIMRTDYFVLHSLTLYTTSIAVVILLCIKQERDIYKIRVLVLEAARSS